MAPLRDAAAPAPLDPSSVLCCFAVRQEAKYIASTGVRLLLTGIGPVNARRACAAALDQGRPALVLSCGFAGGLNPLLAVGTVLFAADEGFAWADRLRQAGACPARFHTTPRILTTAGEKRALWELSGADAAEMESAAIRELCHSRGVPSITLRAVSDAAAEDLPLDFNRLLTADQRFSCAKLWRELPKALARLPALLRLGRRSDLAARNLAVVITRIVGG